jgi:uncharacterized protein (TIGR00369 family)
MDPSERSRTVTWQDPSAHVDAAKTTSGLDRLRAMLHGGTPRPPMAELVDIRIASVEPGLVVFEGEPAEFHYNLGGVAHGGFACTILDSALGCAVTSLLPAGKSCTTTDLHVRFVRPITTAAGKLRCEARVLHLGRTLATAEARLADADGKLFAHATTACAILTES